MYNELVITGLLRSREVIYEKWLSNSYSMISQKIDALLTIISV